MRALLRLRLQMLVCCLLVWPAVGIYADATPVELPQDECPPLPEGVEQSLVLIHRVYWPGFRHHRGCGSFVNAYGDVVSCSHVDHDPRDTFIETADGQIYDVTAVLAEDRENDLVLLAVDFPHYPAPFLPVSSASPDVGDDVFLSRDLPGKKREVLCGPVTDLWSVPGLGRFVEINVPVVPGWSGSGVVNVEGELVGVVARGSSHGDGVGEASRAEEVSRLISRRGFDFLGFEQEEFDFASCNAKDLLRAGRMCRSQGDHVRAIYYFGLAFEKDPGLCDAYTAAAECHSELGEREEAVEMLEHALRLKADDPDVYYRLGWAYDKIGLPEMALVCYKEAIGPNPSNSSTCFLLGQACAHHGQYGLAVAAFESALRYCPEDVSSYVGLGSAYKDLGQYEKALSVFETAVRLDPDYSLAHLCLGEAYEKLGFHGRAIREYQEAGRLDPSDSFSQANLARFYMAQGDLWHSIERCWFLKTSGTWLARFLADEILVDYAVGVENHANAEQ